MKPIHITLLCVILLMQGIGQSYAATMMMGIPAPESSQMMDMPCHQTDKQVAMDNCCEQDCHCHFLMSATHHAQLEFSHIKPSAEFTQYAYFFSEKALTSLYRPPIFA